MKKISSVAIAAFLAENGTKVSEVTVRRVREGRTKNSRFAAEITAAALVLEAIEMRKVAALRSKAGLQEIVNA